MTSRLRRIEYSAAAMLAVVAMIGGAQASPIAEVTGLVNSAFRSPPGEDERPVQVSDELVQDEAVRTDADSTVELGFIDGSQMSLEPESELILSKYVFDPEGKATAAVIELQSGTFHYTSNGAPDQDVVLKTPVATIGIRGTELFIVIAPSLTNPALLSMKVDVLDGLINVQPTGKGKGGKAETGQSVSVESPDDDASVGDIGDVATAAGTAAPPAAVSGAQDDDNEGPGKAGGESGNSGPKGDARPGGG